MTEKREIGTKGENEAVNFLLANGYNVVHRNFRFGRGEIDIIAQNDKVLVFIEVKTRNNSNFGYPEDFVSEHQQERIHLVAEEYIVKSGWQGDIRFDVIAILNNKDEYQLDHFEDAF